MLEVQFTHGSVRHGVLRSQTRLIAIIRNNVLDFIGGSFLGKRWHALERSRIRLLQTIPGGHL
jgi:hypothetical protein